MYGKWYSQTYTGSMCGAGLNVFAVWGYIVAHTHAGSSTVEIHPKIVAASLGCEVEEVEKALTYLCSPDPESRSKRDEGKRLIKEGQFIYRVPNFSTYRTHRDDEERREYNRTKKRESRQRLSKCLSTPVSHGQPPSATVSPSRSISRSISSKQEEEFLGTSNSNIHEESVVNYTHREAQQNALPCVEPGKVVPSKYSPPSLEEVSEYCKQRHNDVDPEKWYDFYQSKGWYIGKNKMKDWKAAVRTWEKNGYGNPLPNGGNGKYVSPAEQRSHQIKQNIVNAIRSRISDRDESDSTKCKDNTRRLLS